MPISFTRPRPHSLTLAAALLMCGTTCNSPSKAAAPRPRPSGAVDERRDTSIPTGRADIHGTITRVLAGLDARPAAPAGAPSTTVSCPPDCGGSDRQLQGVWVEEIPGDAHRGEKSHVTVLKGARLLRRTAAGVVPIQFADLRPGQRADVWFAGEVALSYPTRATASVIAVDEP